ncbi:MAG: glycosyltransferase [Armatimonadetes bacterium]|nr:glycosyltransferase [Armatimonadota bacterium]
MPRERLRIAIFSDSALPILNGVSISIDTLIHGLRDAGHSVHLFTAAAPGYRDPDANTYRTRAFESPWTKGYPLAVPPFIGLLRKFRRHEFDLIHTHTPFTLGFVGLRWAQSHEIPIVSTYHTLYDRYAHYIPYFPRRYVRFKMAKHTSFYYGSVDHVIVPSHAAYRWLRRHSVATPATIIPTSRRIGAELDRSEMRRKLGFAPDQKVLLYVGRLAREKNLTVLFEMAARVFQKDPNARLCLVGDGPYRWECDEMVRQLGIGDRVRFFGFIPREAVDEVYAASDLFVFASVTETQGLVVQEAMAYGLPAVVVAGGGAGEAVDNQVDGFIVPNDARSFADCVLRVLADDEMHARMSTEALKSVRDAGAATMVQSVLNVYHQVLDAKVPEALGAATGLLL